MEMTGNGRAWPDTSAASWSSSPLVLMMAPAIWLIFDGTTVDSLYYLYYQPSPLNPRTESPGCLYWEIYCTSDFSHNRSVEWTYQICVCLSHVLSLCDSDFCVRACVCVGNWGSWGSRCGFSVELWFQLEIPELWPHTGKIPDLKSPSAIW